MDTEFRTVRHPKVARCQQQIGVRAQLFDPNPYNTEKLVQARDTDRYGTRTDVPIVDVRGTGEDDLADGIPDF